MPGVSSGLEEAKDQGRKSATRTEIATVSTDRPSIRKGRTGAEVQKKNKVMTRSIRKQIMPQNK